MKVLKSKIFSNGNDGGLTDFVNNNQISKNDIQQIVYNGYQFILFYWKQIKNNQYELNATEKYDYAYQEAVNDREDWK